MTGVQTCALPILELILIFPKIDGVYLDLSDDVLMESFSGVLISKTLGHHEFDIA